MRTKINSRTSQALLAFLSFVGLGLFASTSLAQLTGTKNIPGDYGTLAAAITDLNTQGVGPGGVTFNLIAGNPQTAPAGGYIIGGAGSLVLTTSSAANPVVFTGNGNTVTAFTPQTSGALNDAIFKLIGADFITLQNFTMLENAANTTAAAATNNMTEFGVALFYVSLTDGAKSNTIQNNTITLNRAYQNTFGVYSNTRHSSTSIATTAEVTAASGSNSNNKVYGNTISNIDYGVVLVGAGTTIAAIDTGNDVGGPSAVTGNTITNFGYNGTAISGYISVTGSNFAIYLNQQINDNASFNTITSAAGLSVATVQHGGVVKAYSVASPAAGTATTTNLNNNTVTLSAAATTAQFTGVSAQGMTANSAATINMNNNLITGSISGATVTSSTFLGLFGTSAPGTFNINGNTVRGVTSTATTGGFVGIQQQTNGVVTALNINNNKIGDAIAGAVTFSNATSGAVSGVVVTSTGAAATAAETITGNDIRGIVHSVAGTSAHSYISNGAASLSQNISSNTFTNLNVNTTGSVTFISDSVTVPAGGTQTINSNSIVTAFNKAGAGGTVTGITTGGSSTTVTENWNNNIFSNITVTGATAVTIINNTDGGSVNHNITGNTINNITGGTGAIVGINSSFGGGNGGNGNLVTSNTITNISSAGAISGITIGSSGTTSTVSSNTIGTFASTGASLVVGITSAAPTSCSMSKNKVYDLSSNNASGTVSGMAVTAGTLHTVFNNLIGDLRATAANAANPLIGFNVTGGTTVNAYFNTVYLNGTSSGALFGSSAISASTAPTVTLIDNIFSNASSVAGAGLAVAYRRSSTTLTTYGSSSNNNDFNASTIFTDGTNTDTTIAAYKTRVASRDSLSFNETPNFLSTTGSNANFLHINNTTATQLESGGVTVSGIPDDFDGQTRNASTPDIGADEFNGVLADFNPPSITYTALGSTASTGARTLTATIADASGVPTAGIGLPVLYWKINAGSYMSAQATFIGGNQYQFTFGAGVVAGDTVSYYIVAQDNAPTPNVGSSPSAGASGFTANPPAASTPPTTPNTYTILSSISGSKTVGSGGNYATLTAAIADLNTKELTGPLTFSLTDASYPTETFPIQINANNGSSATNTVTIKPAAGVSPSISGSSATALIILNGADYIIIDGSNSTGSTVNTICPRFTASRNTTFTNTNVGTSSAVIWLQTTAGADPATNNIVRNNNLVGSGNTQTLFGVGSGSPTISTSSSGTGNNTNTINNNNISATQYGIYSQGASAANKNTGNIINLNLINTVSPNNVAKGGILTGFENNLTVSGNTIDGINNSVDNFGIMLGLGTSFSNASTTGNEVTNATISRNTVGSVICSGTNTAFGIALASAATGTNQISNNLIYGVTSNSTSPDITAGIYLGGGAATTQIYYNSVSMTGDRGSGTSMPGFALAIAGTTPVIDIRDNILYNTQTTSSTGKSYSIGLAYTSTTGNYANLISNNDDFFGSGTLYRVGVTGSLGTSGTDRTTLANWQAETGRDSASVFGDPQFVSATDLHIKTTVATPVSNAGTPLAAVTDDIDCDARNASTPDIGADEGNFITPIANDIAATAILVPAPGGVVVNGASVTPQASFTNVGTATQTNVMVQFTITGPGGYSYLNAQTIASINANQTVTVTFAAAPVFTTAGSYTSTATVTTPDQNAANDSVSAMFTVSNPLSGTYTAGGGGDFASLTNPGGVFDSINNLGTTSNLVINITSDLTGETGAISLNQIAGGFSVTIKPSGAARTVTSTATAVNLIVLNGADNVTIDGSLAGGTDLSLTLFNSNATGSGTTVVAILSGGVAAGATNDVLKNTVVQNGANFGTTGSSTLFNFGIYVNGADNDNLTIQNNLVQRANVGMQIFGTTTGLLDNLVIQDNTVGGALATDFIGIQGVILGQATGAVVTRNTVRNIIATTAQDGGGLFLSTGFVNSSVTRNTVNNLEESNTGGYGMTGIYIVTGTASSSLTVANNFVYDIRGTSYTTSALGDTVVGIRITGTNTGGVNLYDNSVNLFGNYAGFSGATVTAALMVNATTPTDLNVRDNIFVNTINNTTVTTDKNYAIYSTSPNTIFTDINYNDYFVGTNTAAGPGVLGAINSTDATTLAALQTATAKDASSKNADPLFATSTNLHINNLASPVLNMGIALGSVTVDFDNEPRSAGVSPMGPDIGADEVPIIQEWRLLYFMTTANSGTAANTWDFEGDGLLNLQEFAFGTNPKIADAGPVSFTAPSSVTPGSPTTIIGDSPPYYFAAYSRRKDYVAAGLTYTVQFSADLMTWVDSADTPTVAADNGAVEAVTVPYRLFINGARVHFFRVVITGPSF